MHGLLLPSSCLGYEICRTENKASAERGPNGGDNQQSQENILVQPFICIIYFILHHAIFQDVCKLSGRQILLYCFNIIYIFICADSPSRFYGLIFLELFFDSMSIFAARVKHYWWIGFNLYPCISFNIGQCVMLPGCIALLTVLCYSYCF